MFPIGIIASKKIIGNEESIELYRNVIIAAYIEGASATLEKVQRIYGGKEHC